MSSKKTQKRKSADKTVEDGEHKYSRTSIEMVLSSSSSNLSGVTSEKATAIQAEDHSSVTTAGRADDFFISSGATANQADDHVQVTTVERADDSTKPNRATANQADDPIQVTTAEREDDSNSGRATANQADDHAEVTTAERADDSTNKGRATTNQADDHGKVTTAERADDLTNTERATANQADDHAQVTTVERAEDSDAIKETPSRTDVWNILRKAKKKGQTVNTDYIWKCLNEVISAFGSRIKAELDDDDKHFLCRDLQKFYTMYEKRWKEGSRKMLPKYREWASNEFKLPAKLIAAVEATPDPIQQQEETFPMIGSAESHFDALKPRTQYRHIQKVKEKIAGEPIPKLLRAVASEAKDQSSKSIPPETAKATAYVLKKMARSPSKPQKIAEVVKKAETEKTPIPYTAQEALSIIIDHGITKETFTWLQRDMNKRNFRAFPSYQKILDEKKLCHPDVDVTVTEFKASVPLQSLLEHTLKRIIEIQEPDDDQKVISNFMSFKGLNEIFCRLYVSWGFDGSSCQSRYKQKFEDTEHPTDEQNMLATTIIPLRLMSDLCPSTPFWENSTPQSVRYCRPLEFEFIKETPEVIINQFESIDKQVGQLKRCTIVLNNGFKLHVEFHMCFTLIDGKVLSHITNTSSYQVCPMCKATPKDLNDLPKLRKMKVIPENLQYGLSPLHAWIRVLEFLLHLGYKNETGLQKSVLRQTPAIKKQFEARKKKIQSEIQSKTGLLVDQPKAGGCGSTNDGNTARTALSVKHRETIARILDVELWLLEDFHTILSVLSSGLEIDSNKFAQFCDNLAERYVRTYGWYRMPVTIHKILLHGKQIIESLALPVGMLSEQAAESRHRLFRNKHSYQGDREIALREIFHRSLEASDPVISEFRLYERQKQLKRKPLSPAALHLLRPIAVPPILTDDEADSSDDFDDAIEFRMELRDETSVVLSEEHDLGDED